MSVIDRTQDRKKIIICDLVYPAVLGSIFYSVLSSLNNVDVAGGQWPFVVIMAAIISFYSIDFLYTKSHDRLGWPEFLAALAVVFLLHAAFDAVNFTARAP